MTSVACRTLCRSCVFCTSVLAATENSGACAAFPTRLVTDVLRQQSMPGFRQDERCGHRFVGDAGLRRYASGRNCRQYETDLGTVDFSWRDTFISPRVHFPEARHV